MSHQVQRGSDVAYGNIAYPGIINPVRAIATRTVGCRPDVCLLFCQPQNTSPDTSGTATLIFGFGGVGMTWTNALVDRATIQYSTTGQIEIVQIFDCRWAWSKAYFTGAFNVPNPDGTIDTATQATLADIASSLFDQIGVTADVSDITSSEKPFVVYDHDRCDDALEELLGQRGYVIALQADDTVRVYVRGDGATLPVNGDLVSVSITIDPPEVPFYLTVCCDKTLVQSMLKMIPVGLDTDGSIKKVNDLSYKPLGGWDGTDMEYFTMLPDPVAVVCAKRSVGKWYQVSSQADGSQNVNFGGTNYLPGEITVSSGWQYLPLSPKLLKTYTNTFGKIDYEPAFIMGTFFDGDPIVNPTVGANTADFTRVDKREWILDKARGIVQFKDLALKKTPAPVAGVNTFADVYLTCSYSVHDLTTFVKDRHLRQRELDGIGEDLRKLDELQRQIIVAYTPGTSTVNGITDNESDVDAKADAYLDSAENEYVTIQANLLLYRGIYPFTVDGVALQIRWDVAVAGCVSPFGTHVAQNFEGIPQLPSEFEKSNIRRIRMQANPTNRRNNNYFRKPKRP